MSFQQSNQQPDDFMLYALPKVMHGTEWPFALEPEGDSDVSKSPSGSKASDQVWP